jgi:hypothetical protein
VRRATKHVLPGPKSLSCPVAVCTAVGTTWEASKLGGLNVKECLQSRNDFRGKVVSRLEAGSQSLWPRGRPMTQTKKQAQAVCGTAGAWDQASEEKIRRDNVGRIPVSSRGRWQPAKTPRTRPILSPPVSADSLAIGGTDKADRCRS